MRTEPEVNEMINKFGQAHEENLGDEQLEGIYEALRWILGYDGLLDYLPDD